MAPVPADSAFLRQGLSSAEASRRLTEDGPNELERSGHRSLFGIARDVLREPMFQLLLAAGVIYVVLGDLGEALMLLGAAAVSVGLAIYQETRSERVLEALRDLTSPRALVIRDGIETRIAGRDVVRGDIFIAAEGDRVAADAIVLQCNDLQADESLLTGEAVPVRKRAAPRDTPPAAPGGDDQPFLFAGTMLVGGRGVAEVIATGRRSEIGKIGSALHGIAIEETPLNREVRRLVRAAATLGLGLSLLLVIVYGIQGRGWLGGLLAGITLAMSLLPEEFPLVLTIFLVLGAWRIAREQVLTRRSSAIETLGAATVLCTDKTGTLTENRMTVARLWNGQETLAVTPGETPAGAFAQLIETGALASEPAPFDPMERAIRSAAGDPVASAEALVHEYGLTPERPTMTHIWRNPDGSHVAAAKGAPETIAALCRLPEDAMARLREQLGRMAAEGLRVLGVARADHVSPPWPADPAGFSFRFLGLIALHDPVRAGVRMAVEQCSRAGIRIVMVTGDHPATARAIAAEAGLPEGEVLTGGELEALDDAMLRQRLQRVSICARVRPVQKLRLVEAFKSQAEVVAMTGDGVNDAPSLKAAHIGIAMGGRGTDVAREAAALVLLDDNFASIVRAIRLGRRIFDNLTKAMSYILAVHVPIAGAALLPVLAGFPPMLSPIHIVFLELVIDPACSTIFEAEPTEADAMLRPPRDPRRRLFGRGMLVRSLLEGAGALIVVVTLYLWSLDRGSDTDAARAIAFAALVVANLALIFTNRSQANLLVALRRPNRLVWWGLAAVLTVLLLALYAPGLHGLFRFVPPSASGLALAVAAGLAVLAWSELLKLAIRLPR